MSDTVTLHGYRLSVYTRAARLVLHEKGVGYGREEIDPFAPDVPPSYRDLHPFGRVPVLVHGAFTVYETAAIARYIDAAFDGPALTPADPRSQARMAQIVSIVDSYGYWPLVRQVFVHGAHRPRQGGPVDPDEFAAGLRASGPVLDAMEGIAAEGLVLAGDAVSLADCHLAPMIDYFVMAPEGAAALVTRPALSRWWGWMRNQPSMAQTVPPLDRADVDG